ncbi:MAG: tetratricopeptide repeat protein [Bacteroidales bacterium]|nr:tetratricopeptide repeat protein [Bacteroidales bacterium]MBR4637065.1 tetratricopeptide repeat protein [Bacteroidales bacterium]
MKTRLILLLLLSFSVVAFGQKMPSDYFQEAHDYFEEGELDKALAGYMYIVENHPRNELYPRALNNAGYICLLQNNYKKAIEVFTIILEGNQDEREPSGGGIMASPYANYCHRAASQISDCYYELRQYDSALHYLALSDTVYPFLSDCGNAYADNDIQTALRYADIYQRLGQPDKAIEKLLPQVFNTELADNSKIIAKLEKLLKGKPKLLEQLEKAIEGVYLKTFTSDYGDYERYCIQWLGVEIRYPKRSFNSADYNKENVMKWMRESEFYQMVAQMKR